MTLLEEFFKENPEAYEQIKALKEQSKAINRKRRLRTYERLKEVEKYKEMLYGKE